MTKNKTPATPKKIGRPSKRTPEVIERIVTGLCAGTPLTIICSPDDMPDASRVYDWMDSDAVLSQAIARARDIGFDAIACQGLTIVDDKEEDPASRRVRSDYRLKLLAKWDPKRYGDKLEIEGNLTVTPGDMREQILARTADIVRELRGERLAIEDGTGDAE